MRSGCQAIFLMEHNLKRRKKKKLEKNDMGVDAQMLQSFVPTLGGKTLSFPSNLNYS